MTDISETQNAVSSRKIYFALQFVSILALSFVIAFSLASQARAQFADSPCDPGYYESLESRAWLEAQREITQNQNLIFKPDSVLEYTCFDKHLSVLAEQAKNMFSETDRWGEILPDTHMDEALTNVVGKATQEYVSANFNHSLLGGRSGTSSNISGTVSGGSYTCSVMQDIWMNAKCMDFLDDPTSDGFFTFEHYASNADKRFYPRSCPRSPLWSGEIQTANAEGGKPWKHDDVETYLNELFPTSACGSGASSRIRTGLTFMKKSKTYQEFACIVPGCWYDHSQGQCTDQEPDND